MDKAEARALLRQTLDEHRSRSYSELGKLVGHPEHSDVFGASGAAYQLEIEAIWDREPGGDLRVLGAIDDGGWRAFAPLTDSFIVRPDGSFAE